MKVTINVNKTTPNITIIKDDKAELEQMNLIIDGIIKTVMNNPEQGGKAKMIGEDKLREMALQIYQERIKANEQEQIKNAIELTESFNKAMIKGLVKGALEIAKKL